MTVFLTREINTAVEVFSFHVVKCDEVTTIPKTKHSRAEDDGSRNPKTSYSTYCFGPKAYMIGGIPCILIRHMTINL